MARPNKSMHRDWPMIETATFGSLAAGSAADPAQDTIIAAVPQINHAYGQIGTAQSALPLNRQVVRLASFISQAAANTVGNATNNAELRINVWRQGVLQGAIAYYSLAVATTLSGAVTAGSVQTVGLASAANVVGGMPLYVDAGGSAELVYVQSVSGSNITAYFAKAHNSAVAATSILIPFRPIDFVPALGVSTTATGSASAGSQAVTPATMHGIHVGDSLAIAGTGTAETVVVTAVTNTTFTAVYANTHNGSITIQSAGPAPFELAMGDVVTVNRISNNVTGLATPAGQIVVEWVPSKIFG